MLKRFWKWLFMLCVKHIDWNKTRWDEGYIKREYYKSAWFITLIYREKNHVPTYTREEVYEMFKEVRRSEKVMQWQCPDPKFTCFNSDCPDQKDLCGLKLDSRERKT